MFIDTGSRLTKLIYILNTKKWPLSSLLRSLLHLILHLEIRREYFQCGLKLVHPYNIIIHPKSILGKRTTIYNNVTIGSVDVGDQTNTPRIGNNVTIFPYSIVIGDIHIGDNVVVQAGSVVMSSVPPNSLVAGNPAKVVKVYDLE